MADAHQNGADTIIAHDAHDIITLHNVSLSQLHDSHILLVWSGGGGSTRCSYARTFKD
jgi:hypothetical protein